MVTVTPYDERDESSGQFTPEFSDRDFLDALEDNGGGTTSEIADAVGCKYRTAYARLGDLVDDGRVSSREIGNSLLWEATVDDTADTTDEKGAEPVDADAGSSDDRLTTAVESAAEGWDDTGERLTARKAAARAVLEYAREHGTVSKDEATEEVYPENPVANQDARTWYRKNVRPVLNEAGEYDNSARAYQLELGDDE
jgi:DNA-binding Lrp family transcriptional regulator